MVAGSSLCHRKTMLPGAQKVKFRTGVGVPERLKERDLRLCREGVVLRNGKKRGWGAGRYFRDRAQRRAIDGCHIVWAISRILSEHRSAGYRPTGGKTHKQDAIRGNAPFRCVFTYDSNRLYSVGDP